MSEISIIRMRYCAAPVSHVTTFSDGKVHIACHPEGASIHITLTADQAAVLATNLAAAVADLRPATTGEVA